MPGKARDRLPQAVATLLDCADVYASEHPGQRVVWFSDITRWLEWEKGSSWRALDVDWEYALEELPERPLLGLYLTVSKRAYWYLINTAKRHEVFYTNGYSEILTDEERVAVHDDFARRLNVDWPKYIDEMVAHGSLTWG
ncbi:hypothetical protein HerbRD11066_13510 [Herbidospora sp. RD11066]